MTLTGLVLETSSMVSADPSPAELEWARATAAGCCLRGRPRFLRGGEASSMSSKSLVAILPMEGLRRFFAMFGAPATSIEMGNTRMGDCTGEVRMVAAGVAGALEAGGCACFLAGLPRFLGGMMTMGETLILYAYDVLLGFWVLGSGVYI